MKQTDTQSSLREDKNDFFFFGPDTGVGGLSKPMHQLHTITHTWWVVSVNFHPWWEITESLYLMGVGKRSSFEFSSLFFLSFPSFLWTHVYSLLTTRPAFFFALVRTSTVHIWHITYTDRPICSSALWYHMVPCGFPPSCCTHLQIHIDTFTV